MPAKARDVWGIDKEFPVQDWQYEVACNDTRLGYWDWVDARRLQEGGFESFTIEGKREDENIFHVQV